jgi:two-component system cell cycle response regulator CtrA
VRRQSGGNQRVTKDEEIDFLKDRVSVLEDMLSEQNLVPVQFRLTKQQTRLFGLLLRRDQVTKSQAMDFLYGGDLNEPEIQIVSVMVCQLRKRLRPFEIPIETLWGRGWYLKPEAKAKAASYRHPAIA